MREATLIISGMALGSAIAGLVVWIVRLTSETSTAHQSRKRNRG